MVQQEDLGNDVSHSQLQLFKYHGYPCRFQDGGNEVLIHLDQVNCIGKEDAIHLLSCTLMM